MDITFCLRGHSRPSYHYGLSARRYAAPQGGEFFPPVKGSPPSTTLKSNNADMTQRHSPTCCRRSWLLCHWNDDASWLSMRQALRPNAFEDVWWVVLVTYCAKLYAMYGVALAVLTSVWLAVRLAFQSIRGMTRRISTILWIASLAIAYRCADTTPLQRYWWVLVLCVIFAPGAARHRMSKWSVNGLCKRRRQRRCNRDPQSPIQRTQRGITRKRSDRHRDQCGGIHDTFLVQHGTSHTRYMTKQEVHEGRPTMGHSRKAVPIRSRMHFLTLMVALMAAAIACTLVATRSTALVPIFEGNVTCYDPYVAVIVGQAKSLGQTLPRRRPLTS